MSRKVTDAIKIKVLELSMLGMTQSEIGKQVCLSQPQVGHILNPAIKQRNLEASKAWVRNNKEYCEACQKLYRDTHKAEIKIYNRIYKKNRYNNDPNFRKRKQIGTTTRNFVCGKGKSKEAPKLIGCSHEFLRGYFQAKFKPGMTFDNHGKVWQIDHIKPLCVFDLTDPEQVLAAANILNLQPLSLEEHKVKKATDRLLQIHLRS